MELVHRGRYLVDWPSVAFREPFRRLLDFEAAEQWLRTEEYQEGDTTVVRAELPGIDPDKDIEVTVAGGVLRIHARREQAPSTRQRTATAPSSVTESSCGRSCWLRELRQTRYRLPTATGSSRSGSRAMRR